MRFEVVARGLPQEGRRRQTLPEGLEFSPRRLGLGAKREAFAQLLGQARRDLGEFLGGLALGRQIARREAHGPGELPAGLAERLLSREPRGTPVGEIGGSQIQFGRGQFVGGDQALQFLQEIGDALFAGGGQFQPPALCPQIPVGEGRLAYDRFQYGDTPVAGRREFGLRSPEVGRHGGAARIAKQGHAIGEGAGGAGLERHAAPLQLFVIEARDTQSASQHVTGFQRLAQAHLVTGRIGQIARLVPEPEQEIVQYLVPAQGQTIPVARGLHTHAGIKDPLGLEHPAGAAAQGLRLELHREIPADRDVEGLFQR